MKVIKKGPGWSMKVECTGHGNGDGGCGSTLLAELGDMFRTQSHSMGEYITFRCPECGVMTDVASQDSQDSRSKIPGHVWDSAAKGVKHPEGGYCHPNDHPRHSGEEKD